MINLFEYKTTLSYCFKCKKKKKKKKKNPESIDPKVSATSNGRTMILSKCDICGSKKSKFIKKTKSKRLIK